MRLYHFAHVDEYGNLIMADLERFQRHYCELGGEIQITMARRKRKRSDRQNGYYWGVVIPALCGATGYNQEQMHEALKWKFLKVHSDTEMPTVKSTSELSTIEFEDFMANVRMWALDFFGLEIELPQDTEYEGEE